MVLHVTSDITATLLAEASKAAPAECCGLLLGHGERITEVRPAANVAGDPLRHFEIDPAVLLAAHREARGGGLELLGYYHSHPTGHPVPSATDCEHASGDDRVWAIVADGEVAFWRDSAAGFARVAVEDAAAEQSGGEARAGILLMALALAAMILANSPLADAYHALFHHALPWTPLPKLNTLHLWINDALMAVFFFVVGLEIKREVLDGALSDSRTRRLPVLAAAMGMAVPAIVYLAFAGTAAPLDRGWAVPAATDIAFAVGVLGLLRNRVPPSLRLFLLTVAIVDDLGAVAIIALFYTSAINLAWLAAGLAVLAAMIVLGRCRSCRWPPFVLLAVVLWYCVLHSGVHATVAGVAAAFAVPLRLDARGDSMLLRLEHALVPWSAWLIVPLFGFANAGVALAAGGMEGAAGMLVIAIAAGLFLGKQIGIFAAVLLAEKTGFAPRPEGASWAQVWGLAALCGIGFTMSLFIAALAFPDHPDFIESSKIGVLAGSLASALLGYAVLRLARRAG